MKFALFYEIPVPRPWSRTSELEAYRNTLEQAILADKVGFHAFWTVEHHFLEEFSHCSNPEVLYGAVAASTKRIRIGYGVRLTPKPYNHPVRSAESAAVLDLVSRGRMDFATGRSGTREELEGFRIHPNETRAMWQEAVEHIVGCWTHDEYAFDGKYWSMPRRRVVPKPLQSPHPPIWAATGSTSGHRLMGELGLGVCSFTVAMPPEDVKVKIDAYREGIKRCEKPIARFVNNHVAAFTMVNCAPTKEESYAVSKESFEWYPKQVLEGHAKMADWLEELDGDLGTFDYLKHPREMVRKGTHNIPFDRLRDSKAVICGTPDQVIETCRVYEAIGIDLLLCLVNPYKIPHAKVMQTIELIGKHVIPHFG
ncbi:MAG TPA: LLM class flavin-dependent oxidoreductase [Myxococcota bacterium]|nr:LLM class flavin-dependent oxidoreductase [Myxococcota bacterium]